MGFMSRVLKKVNNGLAANDGTGQSLRDGMSDVSGNWDVITETINSLAASVGSGQKPYATLAALQADASQPNGTIAVVFADTTPAYNTTYVMQGGAWIAAYDRLTYALGNGSGFQQAGEGARRRDLQDKARDLKSVLDYALPGAADSSAALQALLNTGASVFIPSGINIFASVALVTDGQGIYGPGSLTAVAAGYAVTANGIKNPTLNGLTIVGASGLSTAVSFMNCDGAEISQCTVQGFGAAGVSLSSCRGGGIYANRFRGALADSRWGVPSGSDIYVGEGSTNVTIAHNDLASGGGYGVQIRVGQSNVVSAFHRVIGNIIDGYNSYGIMLYRNGPYIYGDTMDVKSNVIMANTVKNISGARSATPGGSDRTFGAGIYIQGAEDSIVAYNKISATNTATTNEQLAPGAIGIGSVGRALVTGNTITDAGLFGIYINNSVRLGDVIGTVDIFDNFCDGSPRSGIKAVAQSNLRIKGNSIFRAQQSAILISGDASNSMARGVEITDNSVNGSALVAIAVSYCDGPIIKRNRVNQANVVPAVLQPVVAGGVITSVNVVSGGSGYGSAPQLSLAASAGSGAALTATVAGGSVSAVTVSAGGSGYAQLPNIIAVGGEGRSGGAGIDTSISSDPQIIDNKIQWSAGRGINLQNTCTGYPRVLDNVISDCAVAALINCPAEWRGNRFYRCDSAASGYATLQTLPAGATPSIKLGDCFEVPNGGSINNLADGMIGQIVTLRATAAVTVVHGAGGIRLTGASSWAMVSGNILVLRQLYTGTWDEVSRKAG